LVTSTNTKSHWIFRSSTRHWICFWHFKWDFWFKLKSL